MIDVNAHLGRWPFRRFKYGAPSAMLRLMDREGIRRAFVDSLDAMFLRDPQQANEELLRWTRGHSDRFVPFACLTPFMPRAIEDLRRCRETLGFTGLRLCPTYHGCDLADERTLALAAEAQRMNMLISIAIRMEDSRFLTGAANVPDLDMEALVKFLECVRSGPVILTNLYQRELPILAKNGLFARGRRVYVETSEMDGGLDPLAAVLAHAPVGRVLFGTHMPLRTPRCAVLNICNSATKASIKERVLHLNAIELLGETA